MGFSFYMSKFVLNIIKNDTTTTNYLEKEKKILFIEENFIKIVVLTFLGGIVSGMVGIGGGMITTPLMLSLGANPKVIKLVYV